MRVFLVTGGWLYALAIVWLSLMPSPPDPGFSYSDKVGHAGAYALLMFWFAWLYRSWPARVGYALLWVALGVGLEFAQNTTGYRTFDLLDMGANALGIAAGAAASFILPRAAGAAETGTRSADR